MDREIDIAKLKYVLYARKSTDDPQRQVRSIDDQMDECQQLAKRLNLKIIGNPVIEKKSAKKPDKRPLFKQMLQDIRKGKYDGILSWHPDRLARNMKEGGEIIDMVDDGFIKDLQFITHHFTNDANGKMLLGLAFVLSKQYSDNLSQNVTRGVKKSFMEGKTPTYKHGYTRDETGLQRPDNNNFNLICSAWKKRLEGISLEEIAQFMNDNGYGRIIKSNERKVGITKQMLSDIFKDTFYFGILRQGKDEVDLRSTYDFRPAITEKQYYEVQKINGNRIKPYQKKRATYYPLRMMIICSFCGNHMYAGAVQGHTKRYLTYRCGNDYCSRIKKSIRGKVIFDFIYDFLKDGLNFTEKDYQEYLQVMNHIIGNKQEELKREIHSVMGKIKILERGIQDIAYKVLDLEKDSIIRTTNEKRIYNNEIELNQLKTTLVMLKEQVKDPEQQIVSVENFLNLSKNAGRAIQLGNELVKDAVSRLLFLNFSVDEEKVLSYQLKPPFDELLKSRSILLSRG